ncbi:MAG: ATP-binding cassette domain-containing protein [Promethearchaeota archaeon]|nr:MAG: ATP-binding cassette domain-containing protein [Candidatus Lokiarchaeota archaeon]
MIIECRDLIKIYSDEERKIQIPALRGCDFVVEKGTIASIVGPSGAGKTTLVNILAGFISASSGKAIVDGIEVHKLNQKRLNLYRLNKISIVDQFPQRTLFLNSTVWDNLYFAYTLTYGDTPTTGERLRDILKKLGIEHLEKRIVRTVSGGELTRIAIGCALAKNAPIILCDEPTGELDSINTEKVKKLLKEITSKFQTTVLVVTHDPRFIEGVDKTYEIRDGRVSTILTKEERKAQQSFPLSYYSHIDSSRNTRIPDEIYTSLQLNNKIKFKVSEQSSVELLHPEDFPPKPFNLPEYQKRRRELTIKSLPKHYHDNKNLDLQLNSVNKIYSTLSGNLPALSNIDLTIHHGELAFIMGPSGSGKTTLLQVISGLEPVTNGEITILGKKISSFSDAERAVFRRENIGLVSQEVSLHPYLTIEDNFFLHDILRGKKIDEQATKNERLQILEKFSITHRKDSYPLNVSGGELQRASLCITWSQMHPIVILDEPTSNLDSTLASGTLKKIKELKQKNDITLLIATHDLDILPLGSRVIELIDGKVQTDGLLIN